MMVGRCPVCRNESDGPVYTAKEMMFGLREEFSYRLCGDCGSLWLNDPPDDLSPYYGDGYYSMDNAVPIEPSISHRAMFWTQVKLPALVIDRLCLRFELRPGIIQPLAGQGIGKHDKVADVGSGEGDFLRRMARCGFTDLAGIDPFIAEDRVDGPIRFFKAELGEVDQTFDRIFFNHSLEHMADPLHELEIARDKVRSTGTVVVRLPVVGAAWDRYGSDWVGLDPPRHAFVPTVDAFGRMARSAGFEVARTFFDSTALQFQGSERYRNGIPLNASEGSLPAGFLEDELAQRRGWTSEARALNRAGRGDTAGFQLTPV